MSIATRSITSLLCVVLAAGCTSTVIPSSQATIVPTDRLRYRAQPSPSARVIVIRDTSWYSRDRYRDLVMDDAVVAQMMIGERVEFLAPIGDRVFAAQIPRDRAMGNLFHAPAATVTIVVEAGKTYYLRMGKADDGSTHAPADLRRGLRRIRGARRRTFSSRLWLADPACPSTR